MSQTIWVAATPGGSMSATGWEVGAGQTVSVDVPNKYNGRFWGRTGCSFGGGGTGSCQSGDCNGQFQCTASGTPPATLAEFNLDSSYNNLDFYDVSMVDGSNLPLYVNTSNTTTSDPVSASGCSSAGCTKAVNCPAALQVTSGGQVVACKNESMQDASIFKAAEPYAYSYPTDDSATMTCAGSCDYRLTFGITGS